MIMFEMRIENINGKYVLCGHILSPEFILSGQVWTRADGSDSEVIITRVDGREVYYWWIENDHMVIHNKDAFSFQCRYSLVIDKDR